MIPRELFNLKIRTNTNKNKITIVKILTKHCRYYEKLLRDKRSMKMILKDLKTNDDRNFKYNIDLKQNRIYPIDVNYSNSNVKKIEQDIKWSVSEVMIN